MADCPHLPRLSNFISQRLGVDIVKGLYAPGEALPTEIALSQHWQISRTAVREGICVLVSTGLIERRTKTGTIVSDRSRWNLLDPLILSWMRLSDPDTAFVSALLELTYIIEPQAAALAARRADGDDIDDLRRLLDVMRSHNRTEEAARRADLQFRTAIVKAARNQTFLPLIDSIEAAISWSHTYRAALNIDVRSTANTYVPMVEAIARRDDAEARWQMEMLIRTTMTVVKAQQRSALPDAPLARTA
ncbi:FadR/GntR family transcriptional regulator [Asticcacaulis solisilvae]|uniref:FadR/GntR family transcriptional regulator n=1 Tax=Asticcacaulis solisilvae TaxID=1217274 RepID=UPI003FD83973